MFTQRPNVSGVTLGSNAHVSRPFLIDNEAACTKGYHLLIIGGCDRTYTRLLQTHLLNHTNWQVTHCSTEKSGEMALQMEGFDAILLEIKSLRGEGIPLLERISCAAGKAPIIAITNLDGDRKSIEVLRHYAQGHLIRGNFDAPILIRTIQNAIERKSEARRVADLEKQRASLQETVRSLEKVLGVVGHELRTPIGGLRMMIEVLLSAQNRHEPAIEQMIKTMHEEVISTAQMICNLLEAARRTNGKTQWNWSNFSVREACEKAIEAITRIGAAKGVELQFIKSSDTHSMQGDEDAIRRLCINLLNNALRHTHAGTVVMEILEGKAGPESTIVIRVSDTGDGIPESKIDRLCEAISVNTDVVEDGYVSGSGLGLAICKSIVAAHGGQLTIFSQVNVGTVVSAEIRDNLPKPVQVTGNEPIMTGFDS
ncbi:MAG: hybrid sensor histidine kinase/response regulator [Phycisphaerales bacterium]|nr:hybrid sensor histidine kinase/response regulator [Phycisphaerales bacterium]